MADVGDGELVHLLVIALLQVDDLPFGRARNKNHREAVRCRVREGRQSVEKAGRGNGEADAGLFRQEARDGCRISGVLLMPEGNHAHARRLRHASQVGDWNAGDTVDGIDAVQLQRIDHEMKTIRELLLLGLDVLRSYGHFAPLAKTCSNSPLIDIHVAFHMVTEF